MRSDTRPFVYLHACAVIPECTCGDREWDVHPPEGHMFTNMYDVPFYATMQDALNAAASMKLGVDYVPLPTPHTT